MAAWLALLKAGLPYVADIVTSRLPVFTERREEAKNSADVMAQQIAELQQVAQHNAESIKALAEQLQQTVKALETGAIEHERLMAEHSQQIAAIEQQRIQMTDERNLLRQQIRSARKLALIAFAAAFLALIFAVMSNLK